MDNALCTILLPVYNEKDNIEEFIKRLIEAVKFPYKLTVIYDFDQDNTIPVLERIRPALPIDITLLKNGYGAGVLNAMKSGLESVDTKYAIITMADLCDPPEVMNDMVAKAEAESADVVCASRYMAGGSQKNGPLIKRLMSRVAGTSLHHICRVPTHDSTNNFKLYRKSFLDKIEIESTGGFELGLELTVKAYTNNFKVSEVPTSWEDRVAGESNFKLMKWLPLYLKWYLGAFKYATKMLMENYGLKIMLAILLCFAINSGIIIYKSSVNMPFADEWYVLADMPKQWDFLWNFSLNNEHRIFFTKFLMQAQYHLNGWYIPYNIFLNYLIFLIMLIWLYIILRPYFKSKPYLVLLMLPMFSLLLRDNRLWSFMNEMTFMLLWSMMGIYFGFLRKDSKMDLILFSICMILAIFSMSFTYALGILAVFIWTKIYYNRKNLGECLRYLPSIAVILATIFCVMPKSDLASGAMLPWHMEFWEVMFDHIGRGVPAPLVPIFIFSLLSFIGIAIFTVLDPNNLKKREFQAVSALASAAIFTGAVIFIKRGGIGYRHLEAILVVIPAIAIILMHIRWRKIRIFIVLAFFALQLLYWPNRMFLADHYQEWQSKRVQEEADWHNFFKTRDNRYLENIIFSVDPTNRPNIDSIVELDSSFNSF